MISPPSPSQASEIAEVVERQERLLCTLHEKLDRLSNRLLAVRVTAPRNTQPGGVKETPEIAPLTNILEQHNHKIVSASEELSKLLDELRL